MKLNLEYESNDHILLPHVVRFSGGRSSGAMMMKMLQQKLIDPDRGDVILFSNTSAEHPATYDFVRKCSSHAEMDYGVPFFWIEFASFEDAYNGEWIRRSSYRLVNDEPFGQSNPDGYHYKGEVFEELISLKGYLPSRHSRICTTHLKLQTAHNFLSEWFTGKSTTKRLGHYYSESQITDEETLFRHKRANGQLNKNELLSKKKYIRSCPPFIPSQEFADFSHAYKMGASNSIFLENPYLDYAPMTGKDAIDYISLIGLRADEPRRVARVIKQNKAVHNGVGHSESESNCGELIYMPLSDSNISKNDVLSFWANNGWDLELPAEANLSNCVFCFMKGACALQRICSCQQEINGQLQAELRSVPSTPSDINWWIDIEERYQRKPLKRVDGGKNQKEERVTIGFWGVDSELNYRLLSKNGEDLNESGSTHILNTLPCNCTD